MRQRYKGKVSEIKLNSVNGKDRIPYLALAQRN